MPAYAYILTPRVSMAVAIHREAIDAYAAAGGVAIDKWFHEAPGDCLVSGGKGGERFLFDRIAGRRLAATLKLGDDIIVANLAALSMGWTGVHRLLAELDARGVVLHFASIGDCAADLALNALVCQLLRGIAGFESDAMAEDASNGLKPPPRRSGPPGGESRVGW